MNVADSRGVPLVHQGGQTPPPAGQRGIGRLALAIGGISYLVFLSEVVFARPNPAWAGALLLLTVAAAVLASQLGRPSASRMLDWVDAHAAPIVLVMIVAAALAWVVLSVLQARWFALGSHGEDTAYYSQVLWNTLHGNVLAGNVQQERLYVPPVTSDLALHVSPVLWLLLPLYALAPHFLTLLIVRDVALAAAAWPLFSLARERMGGSSGVAAVVLYLLNPVVVAQSVEAFYLVQLAPLPFFLALRAFAREDLARFCLWIVVAMSMREDVAIAVAGFGLWSVATRRPLRWSAIALGLPAVWWVVATMLIQPAFGRSGNNVVEIKFAGGASSGLGIYQVFFGNPMWLIELLRERGLHYVYRELRSVGFLSLLGWDGLLALPGFAANLFLARMFYQAVDPISRLALLPACALIGSSVLVAARLTARTGRPSHARALALMLLVVLPSASLLDGMKDAVQERLGSYTVVNDGAALRDAIQRIPRSASVAAPNYALPALSSRERLYYVQYLHMYPGARPEYVLVDRDLARVARNPELQERYASLLRSLAESKDHVVVWERGDYQLVRRRASGAAAGPPPDATS